MGDGYDIVAQTINAKKFSIIFLSIVLGGILASIYIPFKSHHAEIFLIGIALFGIGPIIFIRKIALLFTKTSKIKFEEDHLNLSFFKLKSDVKVCEEYITYQDIESCVISSSYNKDSTLILNMIYEPAKRLTFKNTAKNEDNISELVFLNIKRKKPDIYLKPTFYSTNDGTNLLWFLGVFLGALFFIHLFYSPQSSIGTLMVSVSFFVNALERRKKDIENYKRLNGEN